MAKTPAAFSAKALHEETDLHRLGEDPVRVVSQTLQLDVAGACLFSYLLRPNQTATATGFVALMSPCSRPSRRSRDPLPSIITIPISI